MDRNLILKQCLEWNRNLKSFKVKSDKRYLEQKRNWDDFTRNNLANLANPKYNVLSVCSQNLHDTKEYPIFFIRERQIFNKEEGLTWVYFGSLFDIKDGKVNYRTTTSYIPEKCLEDLNI
jgi:hypothetical protein